MYLLILSMNWIESVIPKSLDDIEIYKNEIEIMENWIKDYNWQNFNQSQSVLNIGTIKATQVMSLKRKFYLKYYLRIKPILRELKKLRSFGELKSFLRAAKDFLSWV